MTASKMTRKRFEVLLAALTRASDEWEAEVQHLDQYGEGPKDSYDRALRNLHQNHIDTLADARAVLVARFPEQAKQVTS